MKVHYTLHIRNPYPQTDLQHVYARLPNHKSILENDRRNSNTEWARAYWSRSIPAADVTQPFLEQCADREVEIVQLALAHLEEAELVTLDIQLGPLRVTRVLKASPLHRWSRYA